MAIELHIQVDRKRKDEHWALKLDNDGDTTSSEIALLILQMEKIKLHLIDTENEIDGFGNLEEEEN